MSVNRTPNRGLTLIPQGSALFDEKALNQNQDAVAIDAMFGVQTISTTGASTINIKEGTVSITAAGVATPSLAAPNPGLPAAGGDDGKVLRVVSMSANAHVLTTPQNKIQDGTSTTKDTATFAAHPGASIVLEAMGGFWNLLTTNAVTLTEV